LIHYSGYTEAEMENTVFLILDYLLQPIKYEALYKKYSARKFMKSAVFVADWLVENKGSIHPNPNHEINQQKPERKMSKEKTDTSEANDY
jgi:hypothetical protein